MGRLSAPLRAAVVSVTLSISAAVLLGTPAVAMSGSSSTATPPSCRAGWAWNAAKRMCEGKGSWHFDDREAVGQTRQPV
jgi:hypothetical protein